MSDHSVLVLSTHPGDLCGGQILHRGDAIVADDDGVVVVPRDRCPEVLKAARARAANEEAKRARLAAGELGVDLYGLRAKLADLGVTYVDGEP
jgi:4-hydroxy-4-methyl-2-oxoglutarate aldolase